MGQTVVNGTYGTYVELGVPYYGTAWGRTSPPAHFFFELSPSRLQYLHGTALSTASEADWQTAMGTLEAAWFAAQPLQARQDIWMAAKLWS